MKFFLVILQIIVFLPYLLITDAHGSPTKFNIFLGRNISKSPDLKWEKDRVSYNKLHSINRPHSISLNVAGKKLNIFSNLSILEQQSGIISKIKFWPLEEQLKYFRTVDKLEEYFQLFGIPKVQGKEIIQKYRNQFGIKFYPKISLSPFTTLEVNIASEEKDPVSNLGSLWHISASIKIDIDGIIAANFISPGDISLLEKLLTPPATPSTSSPTIILRASPSAPFLNPPSTLNHDSAIRIVPFPGSRVASNTSPQILAHNFANYSLGATARSIRSDDDELLNDYSVSDVVRKIKEIEERYKYLIEGETQILWLILNDIKQELENRYRKYCGSEYLDFIKSRGGLDIFGLTIRLAWQEADVDPRNISVVDWYKDFYIIAPSFHRMGVPPKPCDLSGKNFGNIHWVGQPTPSGRDLGGLYLYNADLSNSNLPNTNLTGTNLGEANLTNSNLSHSGFHLTELSRAKLIGTDLKSAILKGANLTQADLTGANLEGAVFAKANLRTTILRDSLNLNLAILKQADLTGADLSNFNLEGAKLSGALLSMVKLNNANLINADLKKAELMEANLQGADLQNANFDLAKLTSADMRMTKNLKKALLLNNAFMNNANLSNLDLSGYNFTYARLSKANFSNADLSGVDFKSANLIKTNLEAANLNGAKSLDTVMFNDANLQKANLSHTNLSNQNFQGFNLNQAKFIGTNLASTNLKDAKLEQVDLSKANLKGANFTKAVLEGANFENAKFSETTIFISSNLKEANLPGAILKNQNLKNANLSYAKLPKANLSGAELNNAELTYANLREAILQSTDFSDANLDGANLELVKSIEQANFSRATLNGALFQNENLLNCKKRSEGFIEDCAFSSESPKKGKPSWKLILDVKDNKKTDSETFTFKELFNNPYIIFGDGDPQKYEGLIPHLVFTTDWENDKNSCWLESPSKGDAVPHTLVLFVNGERFSFKTGLYETTNIELSMKDDKPLWEAKYSELGHTHIFLDFSIDDDFPRIFSSKRKIPNTCEIKIYNIQLVYDSKEINEDLLALKNNVNTTIALLAKIFALNATYLDNDKGEVCSILFWAKKLKKIQGLKPSDSDEKLKRVAQQAITERMINIEDNSFFTKRFSNGYWNAFLENKTLMEDFCKEDFDYSVSLDRFKKDGIIINHEGFTNAEQYLLYKDKLKIYLKVSWALAHAAEASLKRQKQIPWLLDASIVMGHHQN